MADKRLKKTTKRATRCFIEIDPELSEGFEKIRHALGKPNKLTLATAAVQHVVQRVLAGELVMTNGELRALTPTP